MGSAARPGHPGCKSLRWSHVQPRLRTLAGDQHLGIILQVALWPQGGIPLSTSHFWFISGPCPREDTFFSLASEGHALLLKFPFSYFGLNKASKSQLSCKREMIDTMPWNQWLVGTGSPSLVLLPIAPFVQVTFSQDASWVCFTLTIIPKEEKMCFNRIQSIQGAEQFSLLASFQAILTRNLSPLFPHLFEMKLWRPLG